MNSKLVILALGICAAAFIAGCGDADSHPSQMVKVRNQMQQQKDAMKGGMTTAPMPAGKVNTAGSATGQ